MSEIRHISTLVVSAEHTAEAMGSGTLPVLATPVLVALMENAAMQAYAPELPNGFTTVGGSIECKHLKPSPVGAEISAIATLDYIDNKKLEFTIEAYQGSELIGKATHIRFIVDTNKFLNKL